MISQQELNELKNNCTALQKKLDKTKANLRVEEERRKQAERLGRIRVQELSAELQTCKDELFNLQPPNQVPDTDISAEWKVLRSSITNWIDDKSGGIDSLQPQLMELKARKEHSYALDEYWGEDRQFIADRYSKDSNILDELLRYNVHRFLEEKVFDDAVYMVGLSPSEANLLHTIERALATLEPSRGKKELRIATTNYVHLILTSAC